MTLKALFYPDQPFKTLCIPWVYSEVYIECLYREICSLNHNMTILDVGANIGIVTNYLRDYGKVYAIEPDPDNFEALQANKGYNNWDNVEVFNFALADRDGQMEMSVNKENRTGHSIIFDYGSTHLVPTLRIDTFMERQSIDHIDFMKLDVEGAEDLILRSDGFLKVANKIDAIEVEMHMPTFKELIKHMISLDYYARRYESVGASTGVLVLFFRDTVRLDIKTGTKEAEESLE